MDDAHDELSLRSGQELVTEVDVYVSNRQGEDHPRGSKKQIMALKSNSQMGEGPAVRMVYEQVQQESIKV